MHLVEVIFCDSVVNHVVVSGGAVFKLNLVKFQFSIGRAILPGDRVHDAADNLRWGLQGTR